MGKKASDLEKEKNQIFWVSPNFASGASKKAKKQYFKVKF